MFELDSFSMTAKTLPGLEGVLSEELGALGAKGTEERSLAVSFSGGLDLLYRANLGLRTALRVLVPVARFTAETADDLYEAARDLAWETVIGPDDTIAVDSSVSSRLFPNPGYAALKVKDGVADRFTDKFNRRPSVDPISPVLRINLRIEGNSAIISLDSSGESLHRRGYRTEKNEAPLSETLAAGLLLLSGWKPEIPLCDPMCGSGTFLAEAGLMACNAAPGGLGRGFGFMGWKGFRRDLFEREKEAFRRAKRPMPARIWGSDKDPKSVETSRNNLKRAGLAGTITVERARFEDTRSPLKEGNGGFVIMNPPYGKRLEEDSISALYATIGDTLKKHYSGYRAWIFSSNAEAVKSVGLRPFRKIHLKNGPLDCRFLGYELFSGTRKSGGESRKE